MASSQVQIIKDLLVSLSLVGGIYIYSIPIEVFQGDNFIGNTLVPVVAVLCFGIWIYQFYKFSSGGPPKKLRFVWFIAFFIFNYFTAITYYLLHGRNK